MPWLSCFIGGVYRENHRPAASLTNFIRNGVSSNKGVLIAAWERKHYLKKTTI
jgi:hypothetical protein